MKPQDLIDAFAVKNNKDTNPEKVDYTGLELTSRCPYFAEIKVTDGEGIMRCKEAGRVKLIGLLWYKKCRSEPCKCLLFKQAIKRDYPIGTKLRLIHMEGEPQMESGITGTVSHVDDIGQIHVNWETGSSLPLTAYLDRFTLIE